MILQAFHITEESGLVAVVVVVINHKHKATGLGGDKPPQLRSALSKEADRKQTISQWVPSHSGILEMINADLQDRRRMETRR